MSDNHEAHACQGEAHDHDHDHEEDETGSNLYPHIDLSNLAIYNAADSGGCKVIKPWHQRNEESSVWIYVVNRVRCLIFQDQWVESDADDQLFVMHLHPCLPSDICIEYNTHSVHWNGETPFRASQKWAWRNDPGQNSTGMQVLQMLH